MHKKYTVTGKVQGVSYRASTQAKAQALGLQGWVCNMNNGDVTLQASGTEEALKQLETWLWQGPQRAHVEQVYASVLDDTTSLEYDGFIIKPDQV